MSSALLNLDARYEALARLACETYGRCDFTPYGAGGALPWALERLRQRWVRERTRLLTQPPTLGAMARHLIPLPCAPTLADPDPNALARWDDDGGKRRVCPSFPCDCPDCE